MTYNWLCNTQHFDGVHENSLIVTLDKESSSELKKTWPAVRQLNWVVPGLKDAFNYGDGYYQLFYLFRANLARALLHMNKTFWMIQQDTYWDDNLLRMNFSNTHDDIVFDRASENGPLIAGGYYLAKPTTSAREYFKRLSNDISWWYAPDNAYMTSLCEISGIAKCGGLPFSLITNWQWLDSQGEVPPKFIQFDGETKLGGKLEKMRRLGFLFLNEDRRTCNQSAVEAAPKVLHSKISKWNQVASYSHSQFKLYQSIVDSFYSNPVSSWLLNRFVLPYAHYCMLSL
ncbi:unnamed protein product [Caenorhabditis auriculariae]|uniref:Nucleotide-diphospho-sugar transferase domain-containing protein n=1 Tax=Caenorhabditis auriculariae TaxID=2777116 RepID=A0A8S1GNN4_9PELO|nr:unnamed protein product [Caenorhabditis auriculariae]